MHLNHLALNKNLSKMSVVCTYGNLFTIFLKCMFLFFGFYFSRLVIRRNRIPNWRDTKKCPQWTIIKRKTQKLWLEKWSIGQNERKNIVYVIALSKMTNVSYILCALASSLEKFTLYFENTQICYAYPLNALWQLTKSKILRTTSAKCLRRLYEPAARAILNA